MHLKYKDSNGTHTIDNVEFLKKVEPLDLNPKGVMPLGVVYKDDEGERKFEIIKLISDSSWEICNDDESFEESRDELYLQAQNQDQAIYLKIDALKAEAKKSQEIMRLLDRAV